MPTPTEATSMVQKSMVQKLRKAVRLTTTSRVPPGRADLSAHNPRDTPGSMTTRPPESRPITGSYPVQLLALLRAGRP
jgi:hypothetical protein